VISPGGSIENGSASATLAAPEPALHDRPPPKRVVIADPLLPAGLEILSESPAIEIEDLTEAAPEDLTHALDGAAALIVRSRTKVTAELLAEAGDLEVIGRAGVGVDNIDMPAATRRGIAVLNAPGGNTYSTAELAFALILAAARKIPQADAGIRQGDWPRKTLRGLELRGRTLGVVGLGRIGTEVAHRARAFGMKVIGHDPYVTSRRAEELGVAMFSLPDMLARADVVTLHVPLTDKNRNLIGQAELASMPEGSILVNAARGGLVDEEALAAALSSGRLAGAGLDVFAVEPPYPDNPLLAAPNLVMTAHLGASTRDAQEAVSREIAVVVRDALLKKNYHAALNAPFRGGDTGLAGPLMDLGRRLGAVLAALDDKPRRRLQVYYAGEAADVLEPLEAAAAAGFLEREVPPPLNVVNSLSIAAERGLAIESHSDPSHADYLNYVEITASRRGEEDTVVGGAVIGKRQQPRLIRIGSFRLDIVPGGTLLLILNTDEPGVIGEVGRRLGRAKVNIAQYHLSRRQPTGRALGVVRVDGDLNDKVLRSLRAAKAVRDVRRVDLDPPGPAAHYSAWREEVDTDPPSAIGAPPNSD